MEQKNSNNTNTTDTSNTSNSNSIIQQTNKESLSQEQSKKSKKSFFQPQIAFNGPLTSCVTGEGECYVWGWNQFGQLGLGDTRNRFIPTKLCLPGNEKISVVACGYGHSVCLT